MPLTTVLFDLDGTLLPMDQEVFVQAYLSKLSRFMAPYGYESQALIKAIWTGTGAMVANEGAETNEAVFWNVFSGIFGETARADESRFQTFYETVFQEIQQVCGFLEEARPTIDAIHQMGLQTVLATNPIFPDVATHSRIRWAGLHPQDFSHITTYENSHFCKPNPAYYQEILDKLGLHPQECLMVGNDVEEDMVAQTLGMQVFLLPRYIINRSGKDYVNYPHGTLQDLLAFLTKRLS